MRVLLVLLLLVVVALPAQTQPDPCESPDITEIAALFERAQTALADGAAGDGLALLAVVEADLERLLTRCTDKDVTDDVVTPGPLVLIETLTVSSSDAAVQLRYPTGWVARPETNSAVFANTSRALDFTTVTPGQIVGVVTAFPRAGVGGFGASPDDLPSTVLEALMPTFINPLEEATLSVAEAFDANGQPAALVTGEVTQGEQTNDAALVLVELQDDYVLIFMAGFEAETTLGTLLRDIARTVDYLPEQP
jgi:hypothetical protein